MRRSGVRGGRSDLRGGSRLRDGPDLRHGRLRWRMRRQLRLLLQPDARLAQPLALRLFA
ncbi:MAG: hypothetical protein SFU86_10220 [Pirellulaceae bacterium]|nr:hypothetical protein [Pirellulaceae bacterium]